MQKQLLFYLIILACFLILACNNSPQVIKSAPTSNKDNRITFQVNGNPVITSGWNISRFAMGQGIGVNITTNMHEDKRTVLMNLRDDEPGTYSLDEGAAGEHTGYGSYIPDYSDMLTSYRFVKGSVTIDNIDTGKGIINVSFSGVVKKGDEALTISEGRVINGTLTKTVQTY